MSSLSLITSRASRRICWCVLLVTISSCWRDRLPYSGIATIDHAVGTCWLPSPKPSLLPGSGSHYCFISTGKIAALASLPVARSANIKYIPRTNLAFSLVISYAFPSVITETYLLRESGTMMRCVPLRICLKSLLAFVCYLSSNAGPCCQRTRCTRSHCMARFVDDPLSFVRSRFLGWLVAAAGSKEMRACMSSLAIVMRGHGSKCGCPIQRKGIYSCHCA